MCDAIKIDKIKIPLSQEGWKSSQTDKTNNPTSYSWALGLVTTFIIHYFVIDTGTNNIQLPNNTKSIIYMIQ